MSIHDTMTENEQENPGEEEKKGESDSPGETNENTDKDGEEKEEEDDKDKEPIIDPKDWPLIGIKEHSDNDVLFGRGGGTNHAKGNKRYRKMVEDRKLEYVNSKRLDKPLVALEIIRIWRAQNPPGRFLKLDSNGTWSDVGDKKAREKTSQALREKAPLIRKQQEDERLGVDGDDDDNQAKEQSTKTTRFAEGTTTESKGGIKKAVLARDHSLGREYLQAGETMNLEGFSWRDPLLDPGRAGSQGSLPPPPGGFPVQRMNSGSMGTPPPGGPPVHRMSSGSMGMPPPEFRGPSQGPPPPMGGPPPPGAYFHRTPTEEYGGQPAMPGYSGYGPHIRTGSWAHNAAHAMPPVREHSLSHNPLRNASATHVAPLDAFAGSGRSGSGYYGAPPPPGQQPYAGHYREGSGAYPNSAPPPPRDYNPNFAYPVMQPPQPSTSTGQPYAVDPSIAKSWSGENNEDISKMYDTDFRAREARPPSASYDQSEIGHDRNSQSDFPRPEIVKRMTSNQNETFETKKDLVGPDRSVKRCALNRDSSLASNRLKAAQFPGQFQNGKFDAVQEMHSLTNNMEQSTLGPENPEQNSFGEQGKSTTIEKIAMDMMVSKPSAITDNSRTSTIEALDLDNLESDPIITPSESKTAPAAVPKPSALSTSNRMSTMEACFADLEEVTARPMALGGTDRVSTVSDYLDLGAEPLSEIDIDRMYEKAS